MFSGDAHFRDDIEGLRGIAILLVVAYHVGIPGFSGGYVGVDVFFVLSGFLITGILVREHERTGRISLANFYGRRARRLLPTAATVLVATLVISAAIYAPYEQVSFAGTALATALYASNFWFAQESVRYLAADATENPYLHTWSLGVEEQFYFVWPILVLGVLTWQTRRVRLIAPVIVAVGLASLACSTWQTSTVQPWAFFGPHARAWEFAIGALGALYVSTRAPDPHRDRVASWLGLAAIAAATALYDNTTRFPGMAALLPAAGTAALLTFQSTSAPHELTRLLSNAGLRAIGRVSYSWYLWHWPALVFGPILLNDSSTQVRIALAGLSLALASLTYRYVEQPVRTGAAFRGSPRRTLTYAATASICLVGLALGARSAATAATRSPQQAAIADTSQDLPRVYQQGCHLDHFAITAPACIFGDPNGTTTIALFGDSHAAQWFPALERIALERKWRLYSVTKSACPAPLMNVRLLNRLYVECNEWRLNTLERLTALKPSAMVVSSAHTHEPYERPEDRPTQWHDGTQALLSRLRAMGPPVLLIQDTPTPGFDVLSCLARSTWSVFSSDLACTFSRQSAVDEEMRRAEAAAAHDVDGVTLLDFTDDICEHDTCRPQHDDVILYRDSHHLTTAFSASLASKLAAAVDHAMR